MRKIAFCIASYKGCEWKVTRGIARAFFRLGRNTEDEIKIFDAERKQGHLAANHCLESMEQDETAGGHRFTHVVWMDDDIVVDGTSIPKLLACVDDKHPVVFALAFERQNFRKPAIWSSKTWRGEHYGIEQIIDYPKNEMIRIFASGLCLMACDREVFAGIRKPYFDWYQQGWGRSSHTPDGFFCSQCYDHHIPVWCHTGIQVEHMATPEPIGEKEALEKRKFWSIQEKPQCQ